jgi:hypothetical protein
MERGPWLAGDSPQLRSRSSPARCRFRSRNPGFRSTGRFAEPPASPRVLGCRRSSRRRAGLQGSIPSDPGIRWPLHPLRLLCPPSPYRSGYASVGRLAGSGASTLSVHGLFRNGPLETGRSGSKEQVCGVIARRAMKRRPPPSMRSRSRTTRDASYRSISRNAWIRIFVLPSSVPGSSPSRVRTGRPISSRRRMSSICRKQKDWT